MTIPVGSALEQQMYGAGLTLQAERGQRLAPLIGKYRGAPFRLVEDDGAGDGHSIQVRYQTIDDVAPGHGRGDTVLGNEGSAEYWKDSVTLAYRGISGSLDNAVDEQQSVSFDNREGEQSTIAGKWGLRWDRVILNQGAAYVPANTTAPNGATTADPEFAGENTITAVNSSSDAGHVLYPTGETADTGIDNGDAFTDSLIEQALIMATTNVTGTRLAFAPAYWPSLGQWAYGCVLHPQQWQDFKDSGATTSNSFVSINEAILKGGGDPRTNPLITGATGIFDGVVMLVSDLVPKGVNGTAAVDNVRRAFFFGADAICVAYGKGFKNGTHLGWSEHVVHQQYSYLAYTIYGVKAAAPTINGSVQRWSSIVIPTYSAI